MPYALSDVYIEQKHNIYQTRNIYMCMASKYKGF